MGNGLKRERMKPIRKWFEWPSKKVAKKRICSPPTRKQCYAVMIYLHEKSDMGLLRLSGTLANYNATNLLVGGVVSLRTSDKIWEEVLAPELRRILGPGFAVTYPHDDLYQFRAWENKDLIEIVAE